jgi:hypothetical protein
MNILRACLDWRVVSGIAALGIAVYLVNPAILAAAFPLMLIAVCPLSMILMMRAMASQPAQPKVSDPVERAGQLRIQLAAAAREQQRLARELETVEAASLAPAAVPNSAAARQG